MTEREMRDLLFEAKHVLAEAGGYIKAGQPIYALKFTTLARRISEALVEDVTERTA
jgi:hypothetical protein